MITDNHNVILLQEREAIMSQGIFTVRITPQKKDQLDNLAKQLDQSRNHVVSQAIDGFLELHAWQIEQTELAIAEADAGDFATEDEVQSLNDRYRQ